MDKPLNNAQVEILNDIINSVHTEYGRLMQSDWEPRPLDTKAILVLNNEAEPAYLTTNLYALLCSYFNQSEENDFDFADCLRALKHDPDHLIQHDFGQMPDVLLYLSRNFVSMTPELNPADPLGPLYNELVELFAHYVSVNVYYNELEQTDPDQVPRIDQIKAHSKEPVLALIRQLEHGLPLEKADRDAEQTKGGAPVGTLLMLQHLDPHAFGFLLKFGNQKFYRRLLSDDSGLMGNVPEQLIPIAELLYIGDVVRMRVKAPGHAAFVSLIFQSMNEALLASGNREFAMAVLTMLSSRMDADVAEILSDQTPIKLSESLHEILEGFDMGAGDVVSVITKIFGAELFD